MANPKQKSAPELGLVDISKRRAELLAEVDRLGEIEKDLARKEAENIIREVQVTLEELATKVVPLIRQGVWNWRSGAFDQALEGLELEPEGAAPVVVSPEFRDKVLAAVGTLEVSLAGIASGIGESKPNNIRSKINQMVADGLLKSKDDPAHSGKGRAPKLYLKA